MCACTDEARGVDPRGTSPSSSDREAADWEESQAFIDKQYFYPLYCFFPFSNISTYFNPTHPQNILFPLLFISLSLCFFLRPSRRPLHFLLFGQRREENGSSLPFLKWRTWQNLAVSCSLAVPAVSWRTGRELVPGKADAVLLYNDNRDDSKLLLEKSQRFNFRDILKLSTFRYRFHILYLPTSTVGMFPCTQNPFYLTWINKWFCLDCSDYVLQSNILEKKQGHHRFAG